MSNNLDTVAQEILQNRREKIKLLNEMLAFTAKESEQLKADDLDGFMLTTKLWEALSQKIDALDKANLAAIALLTQEEGEENAAFNAELSRLDNEASDILRKIEKEQSECNAVAALKMEQYKGELRELKKSNQRVVSYTGSYAKSQDGIYFDKKK